MRTLRLVRVAAEAEALRLREQARRTVVRAVIGAVGLGFLAAAVVLGHLAAWYWLRGYWAEPVTALAMGGADLAIAVALFLVAARSSPGKVEAEALAIRRRAWDGVAGVAALWRLAVRLLCRVAAPRGRK